MWDTDRFYRTRAEAIRDIEEHAIKMGLLPISWSTPDKKLTIGRTQKPGNESLSYLASAGTERPRAGRHVIEVAPESSFRFDVKGQPVIARIRSRPRPLSGQSGTATAGSHRDG